MGWTWRGDSAETLLTQYPELANIQSLTQRWPSLAEAAERLRVSGQLPNVLPWIIILSEEACDFKVHKWCFEEWINSAFWRQCSCSCLVVQKTFLSLTV